MRIPKFPKALPDGVAFPDRRADRTPVANGVAPADDGDPIDFTPVPRLRARRDGWTEARQRAFIAALARCGSVSAAARHVGLTARGAYRLCDAAGAESFVRAWDTAIDCGIARVQATSLQRSLEGDFVPVYRRGKLARVEHRRNDRLAVALMAGRDRIGDDSRRTALSRREHRLDLAALDAARAERVRALAEAEAAFRAEVDRLVDTIQLRCEPSIRAL